MAVDTCSELVDRLWSALGGAETTTQYLTASGPACSLPSVFAVDDLAAATVGVASLAAAELSAVRHAIDMPAVTVDRRQASAAFVGELLFAPEGWERPAAWDPIAGDYEAADGWIRLHTNYRNHRDAVTKVLGDLTERSEVAATVASWTAEELETAVVAAGGCAAAMHTREEWLGSAPGSSAAHEPAAGLAKWLTAGAPRYGRKAARRPLSGIRILDLTRVIAGPVCTQFLAAYGAEVLRIDPPQFAEVGALLPVTTSGKRCAALDLSGAADRQVFESLLADADVVVTGLRPGAVTGLGYDVAGVRRINPDIITASLDAYGWKGPWATRRGFDSLVQMSSGIADAGRSASGQERPKPLPAQALDHGTGYLLAAAVCRSLTERLTVQASTDVRCSLIATANLLCEYPKTGGLEEIGATWEAADTEATTTAWGPARRVPVPGRIAGIPAVLGIDAGPLGRHEPSWG